MGSWSVALGSGDNSGTPLELRSHMRIGSVTKTLTATAVLQLADRGLIGLDRPIARYLPGLVPNGKSITVRQLLNMTSGLFNTTEDCSLNQLLDRDPYHSFTVREALSYAFRHPPYFPPGKGWHYANTNYDVLGLLLEKVTGQSAPVVLRRQIFEPLQLTGTALPGEGFAGLPRPHPRGYQFGTNVQGLNAYLALLRGDIDDARIDVPRGTPPADATFWNLSYSWTSGSVTSTLADMAVWAKALATGRLLSPKLHRQQLRPAPGTTYGLGITQVLPGFLGHSGAVNGFQSVSAIRRSEAPRSSFWSTTSWRPTPRSRRPCRLIGWLVSFTARCSPMRPSALQRQLPDPSGRGRSPSRRAAEFNLTTVRRTREDPCAWIG